MRLVLTSFWVDTPQGNVANAIGELAIHERTVRLPDLRSQLVSGLADVAGPAPPNALHGGSLADPSDLHDGTARHEQPGTRRTTEFDTLLMSHLSSPIATLRAPASRPARKPVTLVGHSAAMTAIKSIAATVANRHCTVMILGETGTGKEMVARYIHWRSERRNAPMIPVDCSALSDGLFESQMFGHIRGAFTGAVGESLGFVRAAEGGTLFLDEIGELSLPLQAKLLRVIQERSVVPVGDAIAKPVDVRIIAATHRDLAAMVREGTFRQDLYYRLNVVVTNLPPLRERTEDTLQLAEHFLQLQADLYDEPKRRLSEAAAATLVRHSWPGNVRELANAMESAHVLATGEEIQVTDLPARLQSPRTVSEAPSDLCLEELERRTIAEALRRTNFSKAAASRLLGINIQRLTRRIDRLHIPTK